MFEHLYLPKRRQARPPRPARPPHPDDLLRLTKRGARLLQLLEQRLGRR